MWTDRRGEATTRRSPPIPARAASTPRYDRLSNRLYDKAKSTPDLNRATWHTLLLLFAVLGLSPAMAQFEAPIQEGLSDRLKNHVLVLTGRDRQYENPAAMSATADYIRQQFAGIGLTVSEQRFMVSTNEYRNVIGRLDGRQAGQRIVVGAHYDVCGNQPGADDNASGVAGLIEVARSVASAKPKLDCTIEFASYALEEPPFFRTTSMGSYLHASGLATGKTDVVYMLCLESIGYFTDDPKSQTYPFEGLKLIYPDTGNFIAVLGDTNSADIVQAVRNSIRNNSRMKCQSLVAPASITAGMDFSDHLNYWKFGYKAVMVTDTAFYRNRRYHTADDKPATLNYPAMAEVVKGVASLLLNSTSTNRVSGQSAN